MKPPVIAVTSGEPAGIGPDVCIELVQKDHPCALVVFGDPEMLEQRARHLNLPLTIHSYPDNQKIEALPAGHCFVAPIKLSQPCIPGQLDHRNAPYVIEMLKQAAQGCLDKTFDALVTAPVQKSIINEAGIRFSGHTEFLADLSHTPRVVMMLATVGLRVALVTTHLPLSQVPGSITPLRLLEIINVLVADLKHKFGITNPHILVAGLNPHAGEDGHLGREELDIIIPVLNDLRAQGYNLEGPLPADTLFTPPYLEKADAVLAMYHDQGLPVLKQMGFGKSVNITLGLPFIRTSVDHGTALSLAGTGKANPGSMELALDYALEMANSSEQPAQSGLLQHSGS